LTGSAADEPHAGLPDRQLEFAMSAWTLKFDSGSLFDFLHLRRPGATRVAAAGARPAVPREVSERRAEAMRGFFPKLASWYEQRMYLAEMREADRYLSQSTDLIDLERRIREIERRDGRWY
jgi:hypothetical protein